MAFCCECRGPCRRTVDITLGTYTWLRTMGAVLSPECAEREAREVVYSYNGAAVVALTNDSRRYRALPRKEHHE